MLQLFDRHLIRSFIKAYAVCLVSLLGLFIVIDLFTNLEKFSQNKPGLLPFLRQVGRYYSMWTLSMYDRMGESVVLLAAMFTVAWIQRHNELLPWLSAGVSTRRVVRPVLLAACAMLTLGVLNQEFVLPHVDRFLVEQRIDVKSKDAIDCKGAYEMNDILISGIKAYRNDLRVEGFTCLIPQKIGQRGNIPLQARHARYDLDAKGWFLYGTNPPDLPDWTRTDILEPLSPGKYFLKTNEIDFERLTRTKNWHMFVSTAQLLSEMDRTHISQLAGVAVIFHMRLTRPLLGMILVLMGLSIILRDQNRNIFISVGLCLLLCGLFFISVFFCKFLGEAEYLSPALAAWLPVFPFGALAFVMWDAVHT